MPCYRFPSSRRVIFWGWGGRAGWARIYCQAGFWRFCRIRLTKKGNNTRLIPPNLLISCEYISPGLNAVEGKSQRFSHEGAQRMADPLPKKKRCRRDRGFSRVFPRWKRERRQHNVCAVTDLSLGASAAGPNEDWQAPLMPSAANKWIIENPAATAPSPTPTPTSEMRHAAIWALQWHSRRLISVAVFCLPDRVDGKMNLFPRLLREGGSGASVTLFTYSFSYSATCWQRCHH